MATVTCESASHLEVVFTVEGLQYAASKYDKYVWRFFQTVESVTKEIISYTYKWDAGETESKAFRFTISNFDHLGFNPFSPGCSYSLTLDCYYNNTAYSLPSVSFSTDEIDPPSVSSISPKLYPYVKYQESQEDEYGEEVGNCVAQSLSTAMEIFHYSATGVSEQYSVSYIFGSDGRNDDDMYFDDAVELVKTHGSPRWELIYGRYPDNISKSTSISLFNSADTLTVGNASNQKFSNYRNLDFYDTEAVAAHISEYGFFMMNFRIPNNFYDLDVDPSGIVPQPDTYSGVNHSIALIGLTTKNGKKHWIAQNSWGDSWGDGGRCYIPYDWGCGVLAPDDDKSEVRASWTLECYAVWDTKSLTANPSAPKVTTAVQIENQKAIDISWNGDESTGTYIIYARKSGTFMWHRKATATETSASIPVDSYGLYEIMVIGVRDSDKMCSAQSKAVEVRVVESKTRPENFSWTYAKSSGIEFNLTADEWTALCDRTIAFLNYTGKLNTTIGNNSLALPVSTTLYEAVVKSKDEAIKGNDFKASGFNCLRTVIDAIAESITGIKKQIPGYEIYAEYLNGIVESLNSIE